MPGGWCGMKASKAEDLGLDTCGTFVAKFRLSFSTLPISRLDPSPVLYY